MTIGNRDFAFDGTVMSIGPGTTNWPGPGRGDLDLASVTFQVNEWFTGGDGDTVAVDMGAPTDGEMQQAATYEVGTRLLVSGEPRWGGAPLDRAIAYGCGGFTRYYEASMAEEWRQGTP